MNKTIIRSLNKLVRAVQEVQSGNYKPDLEITSPPEINLFAAMFSKMIEEIDQKNHALLDYSITLEEKVEEKTRHLQNTLEDLKNAQSNLIRQEKLASLGQLAAGVAHEINNPAGFIASNLQTMAEYFEVIQEVVTVHEELAETAIQRNWDKVAGIRQKLIEYQQSADFDYVMKDSGNLLSESSEGADRIKRIVHGLKAYARAESEELMEADMNEVVKDALKLTANELKYTCTVTLNLTPLPRILCQPDKLTQVFVNLLLNAAQAVDDKGIIEIKTSSSPEEVRIEIIDNGKGIPEEHQNRLYDPFFTTKKVGEGTGLGLSISQGIIKNHDGKIDVSSRPGEGTNFMITLPLRTRTIPDD